MDGMVPELALARCVAIPRPKVASGARARPFGAWRGVDKMTSLGGFRTECIRDAWTYAFPGGGRDGGNAVLRSAHRVAHALRACIRLGIAGVELGGYCVAAAVRKRMACPERDTDRGDMPSRSTD